MSQTHLIPRSLQAALDNAEARADPTWFTSLPARKREEASFHDMSHSWDSIDTPDAGLANKKYYSTTHLSQQYLNEWLQEHAQNKVFLDYACGAGDGCIRAVKAGARLAVGIDISPGSIDVAKRRAAREGVSERCYFLHGDCESTGLPDNTFDAVLCAGMLHHLDLSYAFPELRRIMKPGGRALAFEALNYNPLIKLYRKMTPQCRTSWEREHILSLKDLRFASYFFDVTDVRYWHLFSILTTAVRKRQVFPIALRVANALDRAILQLYPISLLSWIFTFQLIKRPDSET